MLGLPPHAPIPPAWMVGAAALARRHAFQLCYPIEHGEVTDWDAMESILHDVFDHQLGVTAEHPVLLTEALSFASAPEKQRARAIQSMFETFHVPALCLAQQAVLSLYASGRTTGCVVDLGHSLSRVVPIVEGKVVEHATYRSSIAGHMVTEYLRRNLNDERACSLETARERECVREIKERLAYVAFDYEVEVMRSKQSPATIEHTYQLPDGREVTLGQERFSCAEILFHPWIARCLASSE